jgi:hypothetical protein
MNEGGLVALAIGGIVAGLVMLGRGLVGYREAGRVDGLATSRIASIALGEVLVTGTAEPIELTLVSPIQSRPCLYYRARISETRDGDGRDVLREERAVGFRVRDGTGAVRVFPGGARFDVPERFDESTSAWSGEPPGVALRSGSTFGPGPDDREAQIAALLTVRPAVSGIDPSDSGGGVFGGGLGAATGGWLSGAPALGGLSALGSVREGGRRYREARIEAGDTVTLVGHAVRFANLADPAAANILAGSAVHAGDLEVALDVAEARAAGLLAATPAEAWGNAAIPGFGIGRPTRPPTLDEAATRPPQGDAELATRVAATFEIAPDTLVLAAHDEAGLTISLGEPTVVSARHEWQFVVGLLGAALAIGSAMTLALVLQGGVR